MKTKILAFLATTFVILAFSGCDFFNSKEGQTSVINGITFPGETTESYTVGTFFPEGATGQLVTINHKDNNGGADELMISYQVPDVNGDGVFTAADCTGFSLLFNAIPIATKLTGIDAAVNDTRVIWFGGDATGTCTNTTFTLQDGGPKALALSNTPINPVVNSGIPGFIKYGTKAAPVSQYNLTGNSAEVKFISTYGQCSNGNVWNDATKACEAPAPEQPSDPNPGQVLNQNIVCYHKVNGSEYTGQYVKCGDYGCVYPNSTYCRDTGCYLNNGTPQWDSTINWDTITEFGICRDAAGNPKDGTGGTGDEWVSHTWQFKDGSETSYILSRTDSEYLNYIAKVEAQCKTIPKSQFYWKPNSGNDSYWQEFGIPECGGGTEPPKPPEPNQPYCTLEDRGNEQCDVCYNENDEWVSESCWSSGDGNKADTNDAKRQIKDMLQRVEDEQRNVEKEFPRIKKEIERFQEKELKKRIQRFKKLLKRATSAERATEILNEGITWLEGRNTLVTELKADMDAMISSCQSGIERVRTKINAMVPGEVSWDGLNSGWNSIRKNLESCWPHKDVIETAYRTVEQEVFEFSDMIYEMSKAIIEMESYDVEVPNFIDQFLGEFKELQTWVDSALECKNEMETLISTLRSASNPEDIDYAQQDVWDQQQECNWQRQDREDAYEDWRQGDGYDSPHPWERYVDRAWKTMENQRYIENDKAKLLEIKRALEAISDLRNKVETEDKVVLKAINNLEDLKTKALPKVIEMIVAVEKGEYVEWEQLEMLGQVADQSLIVLAKFCDTNPDSCSLSPELEGMIYDRYHHDGGPGPDFRDNFNQKYFDEELIDRLVNDIVARISEEIANTFVEQFTRIFTETMAAKIAEHMEGEAEEILAYLFNNGDKLGDERTRKVAENSTEVYDVLVKFEGYDLEPDVAAIVNDWNKVVVSASLKAEVVSKFEELLKAVQNKEKTAETVASLRDKLAQNDKLLAVEDRVQFLDARIGANDWYYGSFMASSFEGDKDTDGNWTGYVRPSGLINRCEALKIAIEAARIPKAQGDSDWWCDAYRATAEREGFRMVALNYGDTAYWVPPSTDRGYLAGNPTRAELCALWVDAGNLEVFRYNNEFPDVGYLNPWAEDAATCKQNGIMEGQSNGNFDAHSPANRAEVATMEVRFREATQADQFIKMLDETGTNTGIFE